MLKEVVLGVDPVLSLIARKPGSDDLGHVLTGERGATRIVRPDPLTGTDIRDLAARMRSWHLSPEAADRLVSRTGGLPLLVSAVLFGAADPSQVELVGDVPPSAAAAARHLLEAVDPVARRLVEACVVLAEPADLFVVGEVSGVNQPAAAAAAAARAGLLRVEATGAVECAHALLHDAIYADLSPRHRRVIPSDPSPMSRRHSPQAPALGAC